jgi:STE24 endopeptidase
MEEGSKQAKRYSRVKVRLTIVQLVLSVVFLAAMVFSGASVRLKEVVSGWSGNFYLQVGLYLLVFAVAYDLAFVGFDFYGGYLLEHRFALSNQTVFGWLKESTKKSVLSLALLLVAGEVLYFFLRCFPRHWWLLATGGWFLFTVVLQRVAAVLIIPLFYKCRPVTNEQLRERLFTLGKKCGAAIKEVFEIQLSKETKKANAAVAGWGKGRRILLGDTMLDKYSVEEIEAIFAHELGHVRLLHIAKILGFGAVVSFVSFYATFVLFNAGARLFGVEEIHDIAGFPLLALILTGVGLVLLPVQLGYLRHLERKADMFAVAHIEKAESFGSALGKLAEQNLIDASPSRLEELLLYDHPPVSKRLRYTQIEKEEQG